MESLDNGKTIRETRDADIPLAIRHFYSHAGWAQVRAPTFSSRETHVNWYPIELLARTEWLDVRL